MFTVGHVTHIKPYKKGDAHLAALLIIIKKNGEKERIEFEIRIKTKWWKALQKENEMGKKGSVTIQLKRNELDLKVLNQIDTSSQLETPVIKWQFKYIDLK